MPLIPAGRFVLSHAPYAIDPSSFVVRPGHASTPDLHPVSVHALWVRRTRGALGVHTGKVWDYTRDPGADLDGFMAAVSTARYGAAVAARWDGDRLWTPEPVGTAERDRLVELLAGPLAHLVPLIEDREPVTVPDGWDGWYRLVD